MSGVPLRIVSAVVAAIAAAWLVVSIANVHGQRVGIRQVFSTQTVSPDRLASATKHFRDAMQLNPDILPLLLEGGSYSIAGQPRKAIPLLEKAVREEPQNPRAWALLGGAYRTVDPRRSRDAFAEVARLRPLVP